MEDWGTADDTENHGRRQGCGFLFTDGGLAKLLKVAAGVRVGVFHDHQ